MYVLCDYYDICDISHLYDIFDIYDMYGMYVIYMWHIWPIFTWKNHIWHICDHYDMHDTYDIYEKITYVMCEPFMRYKISRLQTEIQREIVLHPRKCKLLQWNDGTGGICYHQSKPYKECWTIY